MFGYVKAVYQEIRGLPSLVRQSAKEMHQLRSLTGGAMLTAVSVIINQFTIFINQIMRLGFTFLPIALSGMLYGPLITGSLGAVCDILKYFTRNDGGAFFPGFTISSFVAGFLSGIFLYKKPVTLRRVIATRLCVMVVDSWILNSLWLSMLYGNAFIALVSARMLKSVLVFPVEVALLYLTLKTVAARRPLRTT